MNRFWNALVRHVGVVVLAVAMLAGGYLLRAWLAPAGKPAPAAEGPAPKAEVWTCSMHPQVRQPGPGTCPICSMALVRATQGGTEAAPRRLVMSERAKALARVETAPVERRFVTAEVRMSGKIEYDETRLSYITAWFPGRIDRLFVDYTGVPVRKGEHLAILYSPDLLTAQEELIQALQAVRGTSGSTSPLVREATEATVTAVREKLRLLGLAPAQIAEIEKLGKASDHVMIHATIGGIVVEKNVKQGMYVQTGTRIYTIADLSRLWVKLAAYESDLVWLRPGQTVAFTTEAYPGETFEGRIAFVAPMVDPATRTVEARVTVPNPDGRLKPNMLVRAVVRATVAAGGRVVSRSLADQWICSMHPHVVKDAAGTCDECGMPLVRAESLGFVPAADERKPLVVPATAPLLTGRRAVVYVEVPGEKQPTYEGREIVLGPKAGDHYLVVSGLKEGELVVVQGNFLIDSDLQIQGKTSMMSPGSEAPAAPMHPHVMPPSEPKPRETPPTPPTKAVTADGLLDAYLAVWDALASDDLKKARAAVEPTQKAVDRLEQALTASGANPAWSKTAANLRTAFTDLGRAGDVEAFRAAFALLSEEMPVVVRTYRAAGPVYRMRCPMAFNNRGATWLQRNKAVRNPYYGAAMLQCGAPVETVIGER